MRDYLLWGNPAAFKFLWLIPLLALLYVYAARMRSRAARAFFGEQKAPRPRLRNLRAGLEIGAVVLILVAAAQPRIGEELRKVTRSGVDVIIAMDTSTSMGCQDVAPTRMEAGKQAALALTSRLGGDRVGLIVFADRAYLYSPLTSDTDAQQMFISAVDVGAAPGPGTNLAKAMTAAAELFKVAESRHKILVLISDGEDHGGEALAAAKALAKDEIVIETIGVGSPQGAPVPFMSEDGTVSGVKRDKSGQTIVSKMDEKLMREIASVGRGELTASSQSGVSVDRLAYRIASAGGEKTGSYEFAHHAERFQYPLGVAILMLIIATIISDVPRRRREDNDAQ